MSRGKRGPDRARPVYARALRLDYLQLSGVACFFFCEGMIALAVLLSLAELVAWWSVIILPLMVAILVKVNDTVASVFGRSRMGRRLSRARGVARVRDPRDERRAMIIRGGPHRQIRQRASNERRFASTPVRRPQPFRQAERQGS